MDVLDAKTVVRANDFKKSLDFYKNTLNLEVVDSWNYVNDIGAVFKVGNAKFEIVVQGKGEPYNLRIPEGKVMLTIWVGDIEKIHSELANKGLGFEPSLMNFPWGDKGFGIIDPDGIQIMFFQHTA